MDLRDIVATTGFATYSLRHPRESLSSFGPTLNEATFGLLGASFQPDRDIRNLDGKVVLVTGGNSLSSSTASQSTDAMDLAGNAGIGKETILQLAKHNPSRIYMAARTESKAREAIESLQGRLSSPADIRYLPLDLSSFKSIRAAADKFQANNDRLDILILNAGTMGNPPTKTEEGFEVQFGTNHIGHYLLTKLLLPTLQRTVDHDRAKGEIPDVRVVTVASAAHVVGPTTFEEMVSTPGLLAGSTWTRYGASKSANIFFAAELARRHSDILSVAVHPGAVNSGLYEHTKDLGWMMKYGVTFTGSMFFRTVTSGAINSLWAVGTQKDNLVNGAYYSPVGYRCGGTAFVQNADVARKLWDWTDEQVSKHS
jgi:NAD(P)-dependent dehydrogenase (short-subunit alcohol dehydrogenase family)